jgi:hypothetical protein
MIAKTCTCSLPRVEVVTVEADISSGLPYFATVGLPDKIVRESKNRANNKAALQNTGYPFPASWILKTWRAGSTQSEALGSPLPDRTTCRRYKVFRPKKSSHRTRLMVPFNPASTLPTRYPLIDFNSHSVKENWLQNQNARIM